MVGWGVSGMARGMATAGEVASGRLLGEGAAHGAVGGKGKGEGVSQLAAWRTWARGQRERRGSRIGPGHGRGPPTVRREP